MCAVPSKVIFCSSLMLIWPGILPRYVSSPFLIAPSAPMITGIISVLMPHMARLLSERGPGVTCWEFRCYRFWISSPMSSDVGLDETDDRILVKMLWETRVYVLQNFKDFAELGKKLTSWSSSVHFKLVPSYLVPATVGIFSGVFHVHACAHSANFSRQNRNDKIYNIMLA